MICGLGCIKKGGSRKAPPFLFLKNKPLAGVRVWVLFLLATVANGHGFQPVMRCGVSTRRCPQPTIPAQFLVQQHHKLGKKHQFPWWQVFPCVVQSRHEQPIRLMLREVSQHSLPSRLRQRRSVLGEVLVGKSRHVRLGDCGHLFVHHCIVCGF